MSKVFFRQPLRMFCRASVFRNFASETNKEKLWDKGDLRGQYRDNIASNKLDNSVGGSSKGSGEQESSQQTPRYDRWNEDLGSFSKKMYEDKGSARWSRENDEGKIDLQKGQSKTGLGSGEGANRSTQRQREDQEGFDTHSAGRDTLTEEGTEKDTHAAGRFDVKYEGPRHKRATDVFRAHNKEPGSGYGNLPRYVNTDSQWTQTSVDRTIRKSAIQAKQETSNTDVRSTIHRWVERRVPLPDNLKSMADLKQGKRSNDDKSKIKK
jgi:hypothetical protein